MVPSKDSLFILAAIEHFTYLTTRFILLKHSSNSKASLLKNLLELMPYVVMCLALFIRLKILIQNRSLFIDEASLARNLCERSYAGFFTNLGYEQYAPPLFMVESKLMIQFFDSYEWAMRLIPFVAGLGTMWILWLLLCEWVSSPLVKIYGLSLFCLSFFAIRYGTEFKQYSGDAFLSVAFIYLVWRDRRVEWNVKTGLRWALLGAVAIWYSMPLVFTLTGVGFYFLKLQQKSKWITVVMAIVVWLISFAIYYFLILRYDIGSDYLEDFFDDYFFNVFSLSSEVWSNNFKLISDLFRNLTDKTAISIGFGMLIFLFGCHNLILRERVKAILLLLPIVSLLMAAIFHYYNLMARLTLFIFPLFILIMSIGLDKLWSKSRLVQGLILIPILLGIVNKQGWQYLRKPMSFEEIKPCLRELSESLSKSDYIYVDHEAIPAFEFYQEHYPEPIRFQNPIIRGDWDTDPVAVLKNNPDQKFWLLYSHALESEIQRNTRLIDSELILTRCRSKRVGLFYYDPSGH